jgi:cytosine permease
MAAIVVAGLLCYALYYYAPAMLGMKTGYPLYVVGSSTFGTAGGYVMPGLLMGLLQVGWFAVNTAISTQFILNTVGSTAGPGSLPFHRDRHPVGIRDGLYRRDGDSICRQAFALPDRDSRRHGAAGVLPDQPGHCAYVPADPHPFVAFTLLMQIIIGFFATAGAAGADFGMNSRNAKDVRLGGLTGITLAIVFAAGLPLLSVAGASTLYKLPGLQYDDVITPSAAYWPPPCLRCSPSLRLRPPASAPSLRATASRP